VQTIPQTFAEMIDVEKSMKLFELELNIFKQKDATCNCFVTKKPTFTVPIIPINARSNFKKTC
jgi:hypothetical protein